MEELERNSPAVTPEMLKFANQAMGEQGAGLLASLYSKVRGMESDSMISSWHVHLSSCVCWLPLSSAEGGGSPRQWELLLWHQQRDRCPHETGPSQGPLHGIRDDCPHTEDILVGLSHHTCHFCVSSILLCQEGKCCAI